jgi:hypothetical protein
MRAQAGPCRADNQDVNDERAPQRRPVLRRSFATVGPSVAIGSGFALLGTGPLGALFLATLSGLSVLSLRTAIGGPLFFS